MGSIKNWFIEKFLLSYLKGVLDKTGKNWKTVLGIVLLILGEALKVFPDSPIAAVIQKIVEFINVGGYAAPITDAGIIALVAGLSHKILGLLEKKVEDRK